MVVEVIGGLLTNSLALLADAGHMLSDAVALGLSFFALKLGERKASQSKTFGYKRFEIIAAALNGLTLILISCVYLLRSISTICESTRSTKHGDANHFYHWIASSIS